MLSHWINVLVLSLTLTNIASSEETCSTEDKTCSKITVVDCQDTHQASNECPYWASIGECGKNPLFMDMECRKSCELCSEQTGVDMGTAQQLESEHYKVSKAQVTQRFQEARDHLKTTTLPCRNKDELCTVWAVAGECEKNPDFMKKTCAPACFSCEYLTIEGRCPIDPDAPSAWKPGDLTNMFERLTQEPFLSQYSVNVLSRDPWVITMENVVLQEEADRLIQLGGLEGYERSHEVGQLQDDGNYEKETSDVRRTSTNAWCQHDCYEDELALQVVYRLSNITGIEETNSEHLQLLRYSEGQRYVVHHDYIEHHSQRQQGVRILTMYLYLNDVEAGGGTNFDQLGITVLPKRGRALLWPSVMNEDPNQMDGRTTHQALPVEKGHKFGANAWFHMHDFKTPNRNHCH